MRDATLEHLQWIETLKEDDLVDAVKIEPQQKKIGWSRAKVLTVLDNHIKIGFLNEKESYNRWDFEFEV